MASQDTSESARYDLARDQFLRIVCHELRSPLSVGLVWANLLREKRVAEGQVDQALAAIEQSFRDQKRLVDVLGDASRLSSGRIELHLSDCDLATVVGESLDLARGSAETKGVELASSLNASGSVSLDVDRFHQAMSQLLLNAVRHTPAGGSISVVTLSSGLALQVVVRDTGVGIHPQLLAHLFDPLMHAVRAEFQQPAAPPAGLGLGLLMARRIIELHGGALSATSDGVGRGATFTISLPRAEGERDEEPTHE